MSLIHKEQAWQLSEKVVKRNRSLVDQRLQAGAIENAQRAFQQEMQASGANVDPKERVPLSFSEAKALERAIAEEENPAIRAVLKRSATKTLLEKQRSITETKPRGSSSSARSSSRSHRTSRTNQTDAERLAHQARVEAAVQDNPFLVEGYDEVFRRFIHTLRAWQMS